HARIGREPPAHRSTTRRGCRMSPTERATLTSADRAGDATHLLDAPDENPARSVATSELLRSLAEVKGQAQFLLYLADQIEESLQQLTQESDSCHGMFLCKVLGMYS